MASITILLVEDDDADAKAVMRAFKKARIANPVVRVVDGVEALAALRGLDGFDRLQRPYIMLVDLNMPRLSGIDLIRQLRDDPDLRHSIAFVLTTSSDERDIVQAYDLNVAGYIVKESAGSDFLDLVGLIDNYWRVVELPENH